MAQNHSRALFRSLQDLKLIKRHRATGQERIAHQKHTPTIIQKVTIAEETKQP